jgi:hypothetical protein
LSYNAALDTVLLKKPMKYSRINPGLTEAMIRGSDTIKECQKKLDETQNPDDPVIGSTYELIIFKAHEMLKDKAGDYLEDEEIIQVFVIEFTNRWYCDGLPTWKNHKGKTRPVWW